MTFGCSHTPITTKLVDPTDPKFTFLVCDDCKWDENFNGFLEESLSDFLNIEVKS